VQIAQVDCVTDAVEHDINNILEFRIHTCSLAMVSSVVKRSLLEAHMPGNLARRP